MSMFGEIGKSLETVIDNTSEGKGLGGIAPILSETLKDMNSIIKDANKSLINTAGDLLPSLNLADEETQSKPDGLVSKIGQAIAPAFDGAERGTFPKISEMISETATKALEGLKLQDLGKSANEILSGDSVSEKANSTLSLEQQESAKEMAEKLYGTRNELSEMSSLLKESMKSRSKLMTQVIFDLK